MAAGKKFQPLRVTASLRAPVVVEHDIHLDGLLAWAQVLRHRDKYPDSMTRTTPLDDIRRVHVPLTRCNFAGRSVWMASAADMAGDAATHSATLTRRKDGEDVEHLTLKFHRSQGPGRDIMERRQAVAVSSLTWVCHGHRPSIRKLLALVHHVGSRRRHGYGDIERWDVEPDAFDATEICVSRDGTAARHMPVSWLLSATHIGRGAIESPYWHPQAQEAVAVVGSPVVLLDDAAAAIKDATS